MALKLSRVLISEAVDASCVKILQDAGIRVDLKPSINADQLKAELRNYDGLVVRSATKVTADLIAAGVADNGSLKVIGRAGTGVDNIDCNAATRHGVIVINAPGGNTLSAAELTCAMVLSLARSIPAGCASLKSGKWDRKSFMGQEVMGKTMAIVGLGRIGREVAHRMQAFGMKTIGYDPLVPGEESIKFGVESFPLEQIWPQADFVTLHVPLIPQTKNMVNEQVLSRCRKGVCFVNCARGGIIDEEALLNALESGQCGGAGLDVYTEEPPKNRVLVEHPRIVCTPHLGASTNEAQRRVAEEIAEQFLELAQGKTVPGVVNAPILQFMEQSENAPWMHVSQALGQVAGSLLPSLSKAQLVTFGCQLEGKGRHLSTSSTVGFLKASGNFANVVSAPALIRDKGIKVEQSHGGSAEVASICLCCSGDGGELKVEGRAEGNLPLLTSLGGETFCPPVFLKGNLLFFQKPSLQSLITSLKSNQPLSLGFSSQGSWGVVHLGQSSNHPEEGVLVVLN